MFGWIELAFAGIWSQVWHWGTGIGIIICLLAMAYFTTAIPIIGPYLHDARRDLLWAALAVAIFLAGQYVGARDAAKHFKAKTVVITKTVDRAVNKATSKDTAGWKDPWNRKEY